MVGTVDYMAPEQVTGDPSDARTDMDALRPCVFFEMLTGKVPDERETSVRDAVRARARSAAVPPTLLAEQHPEFMAVFERAMAGSRVTATCRWVILHETRPRPSLGPIAPGRNRWWRPARRGHRK